MANHGYWSLLDTLWWTNILLMAADGCWNWWQMMTQIPSGNLTFCHGKSPCFMGKSTISMAIFHCYVSSPEGTGHHSWTIHVHQWVETSDFSIGVLILCPKGHNDRLLHLTRLEPATAQMSVAFFHDEATQIWWILDVTWCNTCNNHLSNALDELKIPTGWHLKILSFSVKPPAQWTRKAKNSKRRPILNAIAIQLLLQIYKPSASSREAEHVSCTAGGIIVVHPWPCGALFTMPQLPQHPSPLSKSCRVRNRHPGNGKSRCRDPGPPAEQQKPRRKSQWSGLACSNQKYCRLDTSQSHSRRMEFLFQSPRSSGWSSKSHRPRRTYRPKFHSWRTLVLRWEVQCSSS